MIITLHYRPRTGPRQYHCPYCGERLIDRKPEWHDANVWTDIKGEYTSGPAIDPEDRIETCLALAEKKGRNHHLRRIMDMRRLRDIEFHTAFGANCTVEYAYDPGEPATMTLANGDPGYDDHPATIDIFSVKVRGRDITDCLTPADITRIENILFNLIEKRAP